MPFHPAPALPRNLAPMLPFRRGLYELSRGPFAGRELHFIDEGPREATAIVLLHGNPTWSFLWRDVIAGLPQFRCVAPDLLGFGFSSRLPQLADHTLARHADALVELIEALDLHDIVLCGQDWGGPIATSIGARLPERIRGLVLANTSILVPKHPRGTVLHRLARVPFVSDFAFRRLGFPQNVLWTVQADRRSIQGRVAQAYRWPLRRRRDRVGPLALMRMVPDGPAHPSVDELQRGQAWATSFAGPVRLVWGKNDPILGRALERHRRALPESRVWVTNAGHFLQEEVPDVLVGAISDAATGDRPRVEPAQNSSEA